MRVLLVESDPLVLRTLEKLLADEGHEVRVCPMADAGDAKVALWMTADADVVLLGLTLFAADSPMIAWRIRKLLPAVRIIVSGTLRELGEALVANGAADAFLPRPFAMDELRAAIGAPVAQ